MDYDNEYINDEYLEEPKEALEEEPINEVSVEEFKLPSSESLRNKDKVSIVDFILQHTTPQVLMSCLQKSDEQVADVIENIKPADEYEYVQQEYLDFADQQQPLATSPRGSPKGSPRGSPKGSPKRSPKKQLTQDEIYDIEYEIADIQAELDEDPYNQELIRKLDSLRKKLNSSRNNFGSTSKMYGLQTPTYGPMINSNQFFDIKPIFPSLAGIVRDYKNPCFGKRKQRRSLRKSRNRRKRRSKRKIIRGGFGN